MIAAGGVETTRFLLNIQRRRSDLFSGSNGPLGRYYMGHISGKIANIVFKSPETAAELDFKLDDTNCYVRRRLMLTEMAQQRHRLLNASFWPDNPPFHDPRHGSGVLSAVYLALAIGPIGRRILPEPIRRAHTGTGPFHISAHARNILLGAFSGTMDLYKIIQDRFLRNPRKPGFLVRNKARKYSLHYHAEQEPNPDSRITLTDSRDQFGVFRAEIDLRFTKNDLLSVVRSHQILDGALRKEGVGNLEYRFDNQSLLDKVLEQASDGYHQVGTTRMGEQRTDSVVDGNLKVHGILNLYVASSSVFPTTGQANSTFLAVAFAARLAEFLKQRAPNR